MSRIRRTALALVAAAGAVTGAAPARAAVVVLTQGGVPQYGEVVTGFGEVRSDPAVDVADEAAVAAALARGPRVVVAVGSRAVEVARARAGAATVVAAGVFAPEPSATLTGVPLESRSADALAALAATAPKVKRVVALHPPGAAALVADARAAARAAGLAVTFHALDDLGDFQGTFRRVIEGEDAVWLLPDARLARPEIVKFVVTLSLEKRIPLVGFLEGMTRTGALLSVSPDFRAIGREAARLAGELDERPARTAVPLRFASGKLSVNERVLKMLQLGGKIPPRADVVQ
jgi:ABC-type uncharacterized transport system substrate-binding protein